LGCWLCLAHADGSTTRQEDAVSVLQLGLATASAETSASGKRSMLGTSSTLEGDIDKTSSDKGQVQWQRRRRDRRRRRRTWHRTAATASVNDPHRRRAAATVAVNDLGAAATGAVNDAVGSVTHIFLEAENRETSASKDQGLDGNPHFSRGGGDVGRPDFSRGNPFSLDGRPDFSHGGGDFGRPDFSRGNPSPDFSLGRPGGSLPEHIPSPDFSLERPGGSLPEHIRSGGNPFGPNGQPVFNRAGGAALPDNDPEGEDGDDPEGEDGEDPEADGEDGEDPEGEDED